jgi:UDP-N-acetylglucosamine kinase
VPTDPADAITPEQIDQIYRTLIHPTLFADAPGGETTPTLILLGGQAGSGKSRTSARLVAEHDGMIALSGDDLRIFHPHYRDLVTNEPERSGPILAEATRLWVRAAIQDCLEERRSLLLEGSFGDANVTLATARRFGEAGYNAHVVAMASPRVLSIVTAASRYLRDLKAGAPSRFTSLSAHDRGYDGTARLVDALEATADVDRLTLLSRNGTVLLDRSSDTSETDAPFKGARQALHEGRHPDSWGARSTMELLGELKQITAYALASGQLTRETADLLDAAHEQAIAEVIPNLSVAPDSPQARFIQRAITEQLVALRRATDNDRGHLETGLDAVVTGAYVELE